MIKKLIIWITLLAGAGFLYQTIALYHDNQKYPAPGKLVDIGGYKLHINEQGTGVPTVILDAGTGSFSLMWESVPTSIAQFTHVYTYDKAGLGWSEASPFARTSGTMVKELHTLLEAVKAPKPYILVGHSLGGGTVQLYANTYPDDVYGLVLVDAGNEKIMDVMRAHNLIFKRTIAGFTVVSSNQQELTTDSESFTHRAFLWLTDSPLIDTIITLTGIKRLYLYYFYTTQGKSPYHVSPEMLSRILQPLTFHTGSQEIIHYPESASQLANMENKFRNKPLIVIANGKGFFYNPLCHTCMTKTEKLFNEEIWPSLQRDLAAKSSQGKLIIADKSGHRVQDTQPELIVSAVKELVDSYRMQTTV